MNGDERGSDVDGESRGRTSRRSFLAGAGVLGLGAVAGVGSGTGQLFQVDAGDGFPETRFRVRIENTGYRFTASNGQEYTVAVSPGAYAAHAQGAPIFSSDEPERNNGLEEIAEDGSPGRLGESLASAGSVGDSGVFATPVGADGPGPLTPGNAYEFEVTAGGLARYLSLATMYVPSNDLFVAFADDGGLALFDGGPISGDVTDELAIWDAGTEINEEPGVGDNQIGNQPAPNVGLTERETVVPIAEVNGYDYPSVSEFLSVTVTPVDGDGGNGNGSGGGGGNGNGDGNGDQPRRITVRVENVGGMLDTSQGQVPNVISPGAYAVHRQPRVAFDRTGVIFNPGQPASDGLEDVAEDGVPGELASELAGDRRVAAAGTFATPVGADGPGPLPPGTAYEFTVEASPGDALSLATMFVQSNDVFYAPSVGGIRLFQGSQPIGGDVTNQLQLWDAGTEVNQEPGVGGDQAPRQSALDTGADENGVVRAIDDVDDGYDYPAVADTIRVTLSPE
jgi:hypothetical protein